MDVICPSCSSTNTLKIGLIPQINIFAGNVLDEPLPKSLLYKCNKCHLFFKFPRLATEQLNKLYENGNLLHWQYELTHRHDWITALNWICSTFDKGSILDIGCWDGQFLLNFNKNRFQLFGIEINPKAREKAKSKGINVVGNNISELNNLSISFDVTTAFDVIEHLENPLKFMETISDITKNNGLIIIASGNTNSITWKIMRNRHWYCSIPEHISFINTDWFNFIAERCNLELVHTHRFSHSGNTNLFIKISETCKNATYLLFPWVFGFIRKIINFLHHSKKSIHTNSYPPTWMSSKDHVIAIFRKR